MVTSLSSSQKKSIHHGPAIRFVTWVGLIANIVLVGLKFFAGVVGYSQALVADAVHSLSDTISDLAIIIGSYFWTKPADSDHPYGHGRIETVVTLFVGTMLLLAGVGIIRGAVLSLNENGEHRPGFVALIAALISVVIKEFLYRWTKKEGERVNSPALIANAWHHRSDAFSSVPALIAVLGTFLAPEWVFLDQLGALIVSLFIMHAAYQILQPGLMELTDSSASPEVCNEIKKIAESVSGVLQVHGLRTRFIGTRLHVDLHAVVDGVLTVRGGHDIAMAIRRNVVAAGLDVDDVVVHIEPPEELH